MPEDLFTCDCCGEICERVDQYKLIDDAYGLEVCKCCAETSEALVPRHIIFKPEDYSVKRG